MLESVLNHHTEAVKLLCTIVSLQRGCTLSKYFLHLTDGVFLPVVAPTKCCLSVFSYSVVL